MNKALGPAAMVSVGASGLTLRVLTATRLRRAHQASPSAGFGRSQLLAMHARHSVPVSHVRIS